MVRWGTWWGGLRTWWYRVRGGSGTGSGPYSPPLGCVLHCVLLVSAVPGPGLCRVGKPTLARSSLVAVFSGCVMNPPLGLKSDSFLQSGSKK